MNPEDTAVLQEILTRNQEDLTAYDIKFLNARRGYLNKEQRRVFASKLVDEDAPNILKELNNEEPDAEPAKPVTPAVNAPTRKELSDQAIELGIDGALVKK